MYLFSIPVPQDRNEALDVLRGIGIILVVIGHAIRGVYNADLFPNETLFFAIDNAIYAFHMPLFFFLSGLVFAPKLLSPLGPTISSSALRMVYPIFVWTYLFNGARALAGDATNTSVNWQDVFEFPIPPVGTHLWFLWALFLIQVAVLVLPFMRGAGASIPRAMLLFGMTLVVLAVGASFEFPFKHVVWQAIYNAPFFAMGLVCVRLLNAPPRGMIATALASVIFVLALWFAVTSESALFARVALALVLVLSLTAAVMSCESVARGSKLWAKLQMFGIASMAIYLAHTFFSAFTRILLIKLDTTTHVAVGIITGLFLPLVLLNLARHYRFARVLGF